MPSVLCGLGCVHSSLAATAADVAHDFATALALPDTATSGIEVYRLERAPADTRFAADDLVLCRIPSWSFDLTALEELHRELEDLQAAHKELSVRFARTQEALVDLTQRGGVEEPSWPAGAAGHGASRGPATVARAGENAKVAVPTGTAHEVHRLRTQLAQTQRNQQETKATVMALRNEFMHLIEVWGGEVADSAHEGSPWAGPPEIGSQDMPPHACAGHAWPVGSPRSWASPAMPPTTSRGCNIVGGGPMRQRVAMGSGRPRSKGRGTTARSVGTPVVSRQVG